MLWREATGDIENGAEFAPRFSAEGLITCVTIDARDGAVLMLAHMNADALQKTLETGVVHYWSRSRSALWRKGDTSGHIQTLVDLRVDCDGDTLLVLVEQTGVACHTGRHNCFFRAVRNGELKTIAPVLVDMDHRADG